jgi:ABC-2 type transport system ATP-binding protein
VSERAPARIQVRDLRKVYKVHKRPPGMAAAVRSLFRRKYEEVFAVDGISFKIEPGERVGFLGPNGAGKTTTLKMLSGLLFPTSGEIEVAGHVPFRRSTGFLERVTLVMGQKQQLLWDLPPSETFEMNRAIYGIPMEQFRDTIKELTDLLDLGSLVGKPTRQLSLGERMKCELAAALLHRPDLLFLDEPTIGLDVSMQSTIRTFIQAYNERFGATIMLTSHYMEDVQALCPRVIVIHKGKLIHDGALGDLVRSIRPEKRIILRLSREVAPADLAAVGTVVAHEGLSVTLKVDRTHLSDALSRAAKLPVVDLSVEDPPLEDVMRDLFSSGAVPEPERAAEAPQP